MNDPISKHLRVLGRIEMFNKLKNTPPGEPIVCGEPDEPGYWSISPEVILQVFQQCDAPDKTRDEVLDSMACILSDGLHDYIDTVKVVHFWEKGYKLPKRVK